MNDKQIEDLVTEVCNAIRNIAHGGISGPDGLEGLAMSTTEVSNALRSFDDPDHCIVTALYSIGHGLKEVAEAIREVR